MLLPGGFFIFRTDCPEAFLRSNFYTRSRRKSFSAAAGVWENVGLSGRVSFKGGSPDQALIGKFQVFQGTSLVTLDSKGRLALPVRVRGELEREGGEIVVARHPDGCLVLYPAAAWAPRREKLLSLPWSARGFVRLVLGSAVELAPDAQGRILIPKDLRELACLDRECALVGLGEHLELWDRARLKANEDASLAEGIDAAGFTF